ncbi:MAG TPA: haloacid dehalogenase [Labilithrix sp.]|jgi:3-deoxy-D-manno-octulosonate 8-phosphate phosphatase (KDO 8-P phosphatase)
MVILPLDEQRARAKAIRLVVTDVDGTLTDGGVYYSEKGEELVRFSRRDGLGVELLAKAGIPTAILTREDNAFAKARAKKLAIEHVFTGCRDKAAFLATIIERTGVPASGIGFIGDDVNDADLMRLVALAGAPRDAAGQARDAAHMLTDAPGGHGAFRDFAEWILRLRGGT